MYHLRALNGYVKSRSIINPYHFSTFPDILQSQLDEIKNAGTWKNERIIISAQNTNIALDSGQKVLNFCANNYLGLSDNKALIKAAKDILDKYGAGLSSVRFICGTLDLHRQLELKIAQFHGREDAIAYASCFDANTGLFEILLSSEDAIISDELNHASIIDGIRLCKAKKFRYKHRDMTDLAAKLEEAKSCRLRVIATDGVFSMDGNFAPLPDILSLAKQYDAITFVDDCHATGFIGKTGRGTEEYFNRLGQVDIINSTLGKALGGAAGGYTTGSKILIDLLRQKSRPYLFSNAIPPAVVAIAMKALDIVISDPSVMSRVEENTQRFRSSMTAAGFVIGGENHPIAPVMLGDAKLASEFADRMLERGIYVIGFSYPVVPKGKARIRVQLSAVHTLADIDRTVAAFCEIGKDLNVI